MCNRCCVCDVVCVMLCDDMCNRSGVCAMCNSVPSHVCQCAIPCETVCHHSSLSIQCATICNTLEGTATNCNALQQHTAGGNGHVTRIDDYLTCNHTATHCNTLQHTATTLQHTIACQTYLIPSTTHCNTLQQHCNNTATHYCMSELVHSQVCHRLFIWVVWLIHVCDMTRSYVCDVSSFMYVTWPFTGVP